MAKKSFNFSAFIAWIVGILVSLAVGSGMITGPNGVPVLTIPLVSDILGGWIVIIAGWIVVIGVIVSVIAALFGR